MRRRSFLFAAGAAAVCGWSAEGALGTIAYIQKDGLWTRDLPAGNPRRLVEGAKLEAPRFSPSGKWLAYLLNETLHIIGRDGDRPVALGKASRGQWFPSRDELLAQDSEGLKLFNASDGFRAATREIRGTSLPVVFDPEGSAMVYSRRSSLILDRPGSAPRVLVSKDGSGLIPATWIGDGILYWEDPDFSASVMADGLDLQRIPVTGGAPRSMKVSTLVHDDTLAPSPDGTLLAIGAGGGRFDWAGKRIATLDPTTAAISYMTKESFAAVFPSWSPDSDRLAYSAAPSPPDSGRVGGGEAAKRLLSARRIWVGSRQLTNDGHYRDEKPKWSAGGNHLLFGRIDSTDNQTLWLIAADNGSPVQVTGSLGAGGKDAWFGYYGYIDWGAMMDWYRQ